ncbi:MAG: hypothetical protein JSS62_02135 [Verrucomicrobia bacterium]|nr:hypothetical protein [Verrucomicrobiota bacterium]MBS0645615.1 hypothetical protein [Verrucomicrobiota bacterium]
MRIDVKKCLVMGPMSHQAAFFAQMQALGIAEFIGDSGHKSREMPLEVQSLIDALHILRQMVPVKQIVTADYKSAPMLAAAALEHNEHYERLKERRRVTEIELARLEPFGEFSIEQVRDLQQQTSLIFQFFVAKAEAKLTIPPEMILISHVNELNYYVHIAQQRVVLEGFLEVVIDQSVQELKHQLAEINKEVDHIEMVLSALAHQKNLLKKGLIDALNHYHLKAASQKAHALLEDRIFAAEAWIPKNKINLVQQVADRLQLAVEIISIDPKDPCPTYLENRHVARLGEDLINIYDTPSNRDRDPSLWVFICFGIFFSMIVADAGYGILMLIASFFLLKKFGKKEGFGRRSVLLLMSLSIGCIVWGFMLCSFFGIAVPPDHSVRKFSVINWAVEQKAQYLLKQKNTAYTDMLKAYPELEQAATPEAFLTAVKRQVDGHPQYVIYHIFTDNVLIELSILIGVVHIILSFLRYIDRHWAGAGWILFLIGGYLYFPSILNATSMIYYLFHIPQAGSAIIGLYLIFIGMGLALVFSVMQKKWAGLAEAMHVIQVFADVMSYLRIYALSLAGMIMAETFDHIGTSVPLYVGVLILLVGHTVNITLALMGGTIHGLRLNFIEWYHYSFEGGGYQFRPLSLLEVD